MKKLIFVFIAFALVFLCLQMDMDAQCAMCKMNAENAAKESNGFAEGLNSGIVYLMGIPYGLLMIGGFVFYKSIKKREEEDDKKSKEDKNS